MFITSADFLNFSLAAGVVILTIFLALFFFYAVMILRDISKVTGEVRNFTFHFKSKITEPLKVLDLFLERFNAFFADAVERIFKKK